MQSATWEVDDVGDFRVKVDLKEERFGKGETEIRWNSRERYENQVSPPLLSSLCLLRMLR